MMPIVRCRPPKLVLREGGHRYASPVMEVWGHKTRQGLGICRARTLGWRHAILKRAASQLARWRSLVWLSLGLPKSLVGLLNGCGIDIHACVKQHWAQPRLYGSSRMPCLILVPDLNC